jgi:DNA-binding NtrC family response regulator
MGDYPAALAAAETAAVTAGKLGDSSLLAMGLRERGRVREILGFWRDALGDYRLSRSCAGSDRTAGEAPSLVDQYVLELRTGDLRSARMTLHALRTGGLGRGAAGQQMLEMLAAYRGVLLGLGSRCIPAARRAVAMAAEQGLALRHALSLLYLGQLEAGSGAVDEALEAMNGARARAGLIGDRHLILLADLALAGAGALTGVERLVVEADELGLRMEGLEARILAGGDRESIDGTFEDLLDLPAPLKAMELAGIIRGAGLGPRIRERLRRFMLSIGEMLDGEEREAFEGSHGILPGGPVNAADEMLMTTVRTGLGALTSWVRGFSAGVTGFQSLAQDLDLDSLSSEPTGAPGEVRISDSPDLYATGRDLVSARLLGPLAAVLNGLQPATVVNSPDHRDPFPEIIGRSGAMTELKERMEKAAPMSVPVLVIGETGTGKELVSRGLHQMSGRAGGPFIAVDCGAIAPALLESELFGAAKGAYTDSRTDRRGLMETADGGTLFLDEIGNLTPMLQTKLLRVLETRKVRRLGDTRECSVDFRLICATNRDPSEDPGEDGIRPDLYYRIAVVVLRLPPLRERLEDIPLLAGHFAGMMVPEGAPAFSGSAMRKLGGYGWPGNIRELRNVVQRALIFRKGEAVTAGDVSFGESRAPSQGMDLSIEACVAGHVARVVRQNGGSVSAAAAVLCCDPKTVRKYLVLHGRDGSGSGPVSPGSRTQ